MSPPPDARLPVLVGKGVVAFAVGVAGLLGLLRIVGLLVQRGVDLRWRHHPNGAVLIAWITASAVAVGIVAIATGVSRRLAQPAEPAGAAGTEPGTPGPRASAGAPASRRRWRLTLPDPLALLCAPLAAAVVTWPGVAHMSQRFVGDTDAKYNAWLGWRMARSWRTGSWFPTRFGDALYPIGVSLWLVDGLLPAWVTGGWNLATGDPTLAYNLALLTGVAANFLAGHHMAGALTDRRGIRLIAGAAFAAAPALAGAVDAHITFVYAFTLPLILREAIVSARGDRPLRPGRLALLLVLAFLCSAYHLIIGGLLFLVVMVTWPRSAALGRRGLARAAIGMAVAAAVLSPFIVHRLDFATRESAAGAPDTVKVTDAVTYSNDALDTLSRPADATVHLPLPRIEARPVFAALRPAFAGLALLGGVALGCAVRGKARRPLLLAAATLWLLGLGPTLLWGGRPVVRVAHGPPVMWLPYRLFLQVPGLGVLRAPYRANFAFAATATALLVLGLDAAASRLRRPAGILAGTAVVLALLALSLSIPAQHSDYDLSAPIRRGFERIAADDRSQGSVMVVPFECHDDNRLILWQTLHRHPSLGCSTSTAATPWWSGMQAWIDSPQLAALRCDPSRLAVRRTRFTASAGLDLAGVARLQRTLGVRYLLFDKLASLTPGCAPVRDRITVLTGGARVVAEDGRFKIIDLGPPVRSR